MTNKVTILPPTFFHGDQAVDTLSPTTFYREIRARMLKDTEINTDRKKIAFVVEHLRDDAWDWWENITRTTAGDPINVFRDFEKGFCNFFDVDSLNVDKGFNTRDIDRMRTTEPIHGYYNRVAAYFNNRLPVQNSVPENKIDARCRAYALRHPESTVQQKEAFRKDIEDSVQEALLDITEKLIRKMWVEGLHPQFKQTALTMDDPEKTTITMLAAMKRRFPNSRLSAAKNVAPGDMKTKKTAAVAAIEEDTIIEEDITIEEDAEDDGEVAAFKAYGGARQKTAKKTGYSKKGKSANKDYNKDFKCNYCGIYGHIENKCRKKLAQNANQRINAQTTIAEAAANSNVDPDYIIQALQSGRKPRTNAAVGQLGKQGF